MEFGLIIDDNEEHQKRKNEPQNDSTALSEEN